MEAELLNTHLGQKSHVLLKLWCRDKVLRYEKSPRPFTYTLISVCEILQIFSKCIALSRVIILLETEIGSTAM